MEFRLLVLQDMEVPCSQSLSRDRKRKNSYGGLFEKEKKKSWNNSLSLSYFFFRLLIKSGGLTLTWLPYPSVLQIIYTIEQTIKAGCRMGSLKWLKHI